MPGLARPQALLARRRAPAAARPSVERAVSGTLDLEDLLFLGPAEPVDLADEPVCRLLERVVPAVRLVGAELPVALFLLERVRGIPSDVADLDACFFHPLVDDSDEVLATILGQRRDVEPDDGPVDVRHEPDVALLDRLLDRAE